MQPQISPPLLVSPAEAEPPNDEPAWAVAPPSAVLPPVDAPLEDLPPSALVPAVDVGEPPWPPEPELVESELQPLPISNRPIRPVLARLTSIAGGFRAGPATWLEDVRK